MIDIKTYSGPVKFGDEKLVSALKRYHKKQLETTRITIDLKKLIRIGVEKEVALNLIKRLVELKK
jgi:hypothetical protein